jgi:hypothetical protein
VHACWAILRAAVLLRVCGSWPEAFAVGLLGQNGMCHAAHGKSLGVYSAQC